MTILCSPSCDRWTERFVPVVPGVKSVFEREPTALELARVERTMEILRNRYERWTRWHYARMLNGVRDAVLELGHVPDDLEMALILRPFEEQQRSVLRRLYLQIYPEAASLVMPDDTLKSIRSGGREVKELSLEQQRILQWIEETIGMSISDISRTTLDLIRDLWNQSTDTNDFYRRLRNDTHFTTSRAATIARTEAQCACTMSQYIMAGELSFGRPMVVTWHNSPGEIRAWHKVMDGQSVPYNELFRVPKRKGGYDLMYCPGDRSHGASAENIVNCRCYFTTRYLD